MSITKDEAEYLFLLKNALQVEKDKMDSIVARLKEERPLDPSCHALDTASYYIRLALDKLEDHSSKEKKIKKTTYVGKEAYAHYVGEDRKPVARWGPGSEKLDVLTYPSNQLNQLKALPPSFPYIVKKDKPLTEMTAKEIGAGTVIYDADGEPWIVSIYQEDKVDLKSPDGKAVKYGRKPSELKGYAIGGYPFKDEIIKMIKNSSPEEISKEGYVGWLAAQIAKKNNLCKDPIALISRVNTLVREHDKTEQLA